MTCELDIFVVVWIIDFMSPKITQKLEPLGKDFDSQELHHSHYLSYSTVSSWT